MELEEVGRSWRKMEEELVWRGRKEKEGGKLEKVVRRWRNGGKRHLVVWSHSRNCRINTTGSKTGPSVCLDPSNMVLAPQWPPAPPPPRNTAACWSACQCWGMIDVFRPRPKPPPLTNQPYTLTPQPPPVPPSRPNWFSEMWLGITIIYDQEGRKWEKWGGRRGVGGKEGGVIGLRFVQLMSAIIDAPCRLLVIDTV